MRGFLTAILLMMALLCISCTTNVEPAYCDDTILCAEGYDCVNHQCIEAVVTDQQEKPDKQIPVDKGGLTDTEATATDDAPVQPDIDSAVCKADKFIKCIAGEETKAIYCKKDGSGEETRDCPPSFACVEPQGCIYQMCKPGMKLCDTQLDPLKVYECDETGQGHKADAVETCDAEKLEQCRDGECMTQCEINALDKSYEGCDYYALNMRNEAGTRTDPIFSLSISNTHPTKNTLVNVRITDDGTTEKDTGGVYFCIDNKVSCQSVNSSLNLEIPAKKLGIIMFPNDRMLKGSGVSYKAYHVTSDVPITVYQFNPFDNSSDNPFRSDGKSIDANDPNFAGKMYSNDASLLIPTSAAYTDYVVSSYFSNSSFPSTAAVIGFSDKEVELSVVSPTIIKGDFGNGVTQIPANAPMTLKLKKHQVINFESTLPTTNIKGPDLTGMRISCKDPGGVACAPFIAFGGHVCTNIPFERSYCDHIEHQLFPVQTWGKKYVIVKTQPRGQEYDMIRIVASENGTNLTYSPATPGPLTPFTSWSASTMLNAREYTEFYINQPLIIDATKPIMVTHYLTGSQMISQQCLTSHGSQCVGDPAMMIIPPVEQFRQSYTFLTPGSYQKNFATLVMGSSVTPKLNGADVTNTVPIANTTYKFAIVDLGSEFKRHELTCDGSCGLFVYGWEMDVSYAYPGGLDLKDISQE